MAWRSARWSPATCWSASGPGTLVIVPGDREDVILTVTTAHLAKRLPHASAAEAERIASVAAAATNERTAAVDGHEGARSGSC